MTKDSSAKRKTGKRKPEKLSFTQDFIPIKNLEHGIIETTDGRYIKILEIEPINFMLRSEEEQYEIICSFASWLKISPVHLQFKSITRKADSDKHIAMLRKEMETEESEQCKKLSEGYIRLIKDVGSREALTRRFFLIFRYEELRRNENSDYGQICSTLLTAEQNARAYFMQCGNNILQPKDPDEATAEILSSRNGSKRKINDAYFARNTHLGANEYKKEVVIVLLTDEQYVVKWLSQYGALPRAQIIKMLQKPPQTAEKILRNLKRQMRIADVSGGYYIGLDPMCQPDQRMILAIWVLLRFIDKVEPMAHYPAVYPSQLFFLKENVGYEIVVLYDGEQNLLKLLQPQEDMKYIVVVPRIDMVSTVRLPNAPCLFATVDFCGQDEPEVRFYSEEAAEHEG